MEIYMGTYMNMRDHLIESKATEGNSKINNLIERYQIELYKVMNDDEAILDLKGDFLISCFSLLKNEGYELDNAPYERGKENPVKRIQSDILIMAEQAGCKKAVLNSGLLITLKEDKELFEENRINHYRGILEGI
jgi:hypothetical protein